MRLKLVVVDLELSKRAKCIAAAVLVPVLVTAGGAVAYAGMLHTWKDGDTLSASDLNGNFADHEARLAKLEQAANVTDSPCPVGYTQDTTATTIVSCKKGADEVVKVGMGASAFWIDRYEASVWTAADGPASGAQKFAGADDSSQSFPKNGQILAPLYALSVTGVMPASDTSWFQAAEACRASGKRLPSGSEWLAAARGTRDPGGNDGTASSKCNTLGPGPRKTGAALGSAVDTSCVSDWGAQDMIGNVWEWTADWYASPSATGQDAILPWSDVPGTSFNGDATWDVSSYAYLAGTGYVLGPVAATRGGNWGEAAHAGVFALDISESPASSWLNSGFRCVVPR